MQTQRQWYLSRESVAEQARQSRASCVRMCTHACISDKDFSSALCLYSAMCVSACLFVGMLKTVMAGLPGKSFPGIRNNSKCVLQCVLNGGLELWEILARNPECKTLCIYLAADSTVEPGKPLRKNAVAEMYTRGEIYKRWACLECGFLPFLQTLLFPLSCLGT